MPNETPFDRLGLELEGAAERQAAALRVGPRRRWRGRSLGLFGVAAVFGVGAAAWAASSLLSPGSPVPYAFGAPVAGQAEGAPIPGTVKLLVGNVPDPAGGPAWGLRYWETDRKFGCVQAGRVYQGKLGQITDGRVFHELRAGVTQGALGMCFALDGSGHAFGALHLDAERGAQPQPCPGTTETLRQHGRVVHCDAVDRTVDFGLLGPNARSFTYRADGRDQTATPLGGVGGYLVVQKLVPPTIRVVGFHHKDSRLNVRAPADPYLTLTPASKVIRRIDYTAGTCTVHLTAASLGACNAQAGFVAIPQPTVGDVRTPVRVRLLPDGRTFRVRFRARQAVVDGRSAYDIQLRPKRNAREWVSKTYEHNVAAGELVKTTFRARPGWHGTYLVIARFRTVQPRPGPLASPTAPGVLVGQAEITFR